MMVGLWIVIVLLCLLIATGSALLALRLQYRVLDQTRQEREAWRQAQEGRQRTWEVRQGKHILEAEKKLADQLKDVRREWRDWSVQIEQYQQDWQERADVEKEVARLPRIEHLELPLNASSQRQRSLDWRPPMLYRANLSKRDLSHRSLERADLREADLADVNFYMADLTGASLTGANLARANLTGANLSGADLRGANLAGASLLVADLHNAVLHGAILLGARHLSAQQLQDAIYDSTTVIDSAIDVTLPRIPGVQVTPADLLGISQTKQKNPEKPVETPTETPPAGEVSDAPQAAAQTENSAGEEPSSDPLTEQAAQQQSATTMETETAPTSEQETQQRSATTVDTEVAPPASEQAAPPAPSGESATISTEAPGENQGETGNTRSKDAQRPRPGERKIIQMPTRANKVPQARNGQKRAGSAKRGGQKNKNAAHREKSS